jgi:hypothetical protein
MRSVNGAAAGLPSSSAIAIKDSGHDWCSGALSHETPPHPLRSARSTSVQRGRLVNFDRWSGPTDVDGVYQDISEPNSQTPSKFPFGIRPWARLA